MTEEFFCIYFWNLLVFGIFLRALYSVLFQLPLYWQKINNGYSTVSDGILANLPSSWQNLSVELL